MKCMRFIADTYHHDPALETTIPETLFTSLVYLLRVAHHGTLRTPVIIKVSLSIVLFRYSVGCLFIVASTD